MLRTIIWVFESIRTINDHEDIAETIEDPLIGKYVSESKYSVKLRFSFRVFVLISKCPILTFILLFVIHIIDVHRFGS